MKNTIRGKPWKKKIKSIVSLLSLGLLISAFLLTFAVTINVQAQEGQKALSDRTLEKINAIEGDDYVYLFCNPLDDLRVTKLIEGANKIAKMFEIDVKFFGPDEPYDADHVSKILEEVISRRPAGIAMEVGHPSKFDDTIGKALENEILFISFSMDDWTANPRQGYVGYEWRVEGTQLANHLFEDMPPLSEVLILDSATKEDRSCHARERGIIDRIESFNLDYDILTVRPEKKDIEDKLTEYMASNEVDGIVSLWGEITKPLAGFVNEHNIQDTRVGGFGCADFEKYVENGALDVLMKVVTDLEGGIPLENLYYSSVYEVIPSSITLHAKPVKDVE